MREVAMKIVKQKVLQQPDITNQRHAAVCVIVGGVQCQCKERMSISADIIVTLMDV